MRVCRILVSLAFLVILTGAFAVAAEQKKPGQGTLPDAWVQQLAWRTLGPANMGGRITAVAVYEADPTTWWAATASGGLLKTTNNGITFEHQFDRQATVSIGDVQVAPSDPKIVWVGTGEANPRNSVSWGDGVYKSVDGGTTWQHMGLKNAFQIGRIAIHPQNPDVVYVGVLGRLWGPSEDRGLYKTTDGGTTWKRVLYVDESTGVIDVQMQPRNPETLLVATYERQRDATDANDPATKFGKGSGVYRSTDGGATFQRLSVGLPSCKLGRIGISFYRKNPKYVYLVLESEKIGQVPPDAGYLGIRGEDAEVGARITEVTAKSPAEQAGMKANDIVIAVDGRTVLSYNAFLAEVRKRVAGQKIACEVSRDRESVRLDITLAARPAPRQRPQTQRLSDEERGRAGSPFAASLGGQVANAQEQQGKEGQQYGGVFRSVDGGESWVRINSVNPRPMYYSQIRVDPADNRNIWILGTSLYLSVDGGVTFKTVAGAARKVHPDHHALWIDPRNGRHAILGNDGGIYATYDRGENWDHYNHVAIAQCYHVAVGSRRDYHAYGGFQDNGSWGGPNRSGSGSGPGNTDWFRVGGGDGFVCAVDRDDPDLVYFESQNGATGRINLRTGERSSIRPRAPRGTTYRFNWKTPFILSPHNPKIYYTAGNFVFRSLYEGDRLQTISPDISRTDAGAASALAESPVESGVLYVGTTDGAIWVTRDNGHQWKCLFGEPEKPAGGDEQRGSDQDRDTQRKTDTPPDASTRQVPAGKFAPPSVPERDPSEPVAESSAGMPGEEVESGAERPSDTKDQRPRGKRSRKGRKPGSKQAPTEAPRKREDASAESAEPAQPKPNSEGAAGGQVAKQPPTPKAKPDAATGAGSTPVSPRTEPSEPLEKLLPGPRWVSSIEASRFQPGRVYVTFDGHRSDDDRAYVCVSEDYGQTWRSLVSNLPASVGSARVIREDLENENLLYLGTEFGLWVSVDRGASWTRLQGNLPTVAVHEVAVHPTAGEIVIATHGRSFWALDISAVRQMSAQTIAERAHLYQPHSVVKWRQRPTRGSAGTRQFAGQNPPSGAVFYYSLAKDAREVQLRVVDITGKVVYEVEGETAAGLHPLSWDLRGRVTGNNQRGRGIRGGRSVDAGKYLVTLTVDEQDLRSVLTVLDEEDVR